MPVAHFIGIPFFVYSIYYTIYIIYVLAIERSDNSLREEMGRRVVAQEFGQVIARTRDTAATTHAMICARMDEHIPAAHIYDMRAHTPSEIYANTE